MNNASGWIGVDLDGTLAQYDGWKGTGHIGDPVPEMLERVKAWIASGETVKIFTARVHGHGQPLIGGGVEDALTPIRQWCAQHIGQELEITNVKDFAMIELWDDRAVQVIANTGVTEQQNRVEVQRERDQWRECAWKLQDVLDRCSDCYGRGGKQMSATPEKYGEPSDYSKALILGEAVALRLELDKAIKSLRIAAGDALQWKQERDQWRECAERLARDLCDELPKNGTTTALQDFHQLAEASK